MLEQVTDTIIIIYMFVSLVIFILKFVLTDTITDILPGPLGYIFSFIIGLPNYILIALIVMNLYFVRYIFNRLKEKKR